MAAAAVTAIVLVGTACGGTDTARDAAAAPTSAEVSSTPAPTATPDVATPAPSPTPARTAEPTATPAPNVERPDQRDLEASLEAALGDADGGIAALIVSDGVTHRAAVGVADSSGTQLDPGAPFRVGSIAKPFVATMVLQLSAEGAVDLDAPLSSYLPATPLGAEVTIRDLLAHRSGLPNYTDQPAFFAAVLADLAAPYTPDEVLEFVTDVPVEEPGQAFAYSNTNYILLGQLVEAVDGRSLEEAMQARIVQPLGLTSTSFVPSTLPVVAAWSTGITDGDPTTPYGAIDSTAWAAGALVSSVDDLAVFATALADGALLGDTELAAMTDTDDDGYGLGLMALEFDPDQPGFGHGGSTLGFNAIMGWDPVSGDILIALMNNDALFPDVVVDALLAPS